MSYGNERDVEVPALVDFVERHVDAAKSILDVGAAGSHATYAPRIVERLPAYYAAIDKVADPDTAAIVDDWTCGDMLAGTVTAEVGPFDAVTCISVIEHVGVKPWRSDTWKEERLLFFHALLQASRHAVLLTAPYGHGGVVNEYQCVSPEELATWSAIASVVGFSGRPRFYRGESPQGPTWSEVTWQEASARATPAPFVCMVLEMVRT